MVKNWQTILTLIAGLTALWYGWSDEVRTRFQVNQRAIDLAEQRTGALLLEPDYTLVFLENSFPEYAYCAALTTIQSCLASLDGAADTDDPRCAISDEAWGSLHLAGVNAAYDALGREVDRFADRLGWSAEGLAERGREEAETLVPADPTSPIQPEQCAGQVGRSSSAQDLRARWEALRLPQDCHEMLGFYQKTVCTSELRRRREARLSEQFTAAPASGGDGDRPPRSCSQWQMDTLEVFAHIRAEGDRSNAEELRTELATAYGWHIDSIEAVAGGTSVSDIRYYYEDQVGCATQLAADIAAQRPDDARPRLIFLGNSYRNLPRGRMELWLGDVSPPSGP